LESLLEKPKNAAQTPFFPFLSDRHVGMDALRIVNAPKLQDHFVLYGPMILLHIDSAPALSGLVFHEPLPANSVVKRVQNLKFFAAGGPTCTDAIVNEVLNCTGLQRLTLAYTDLSPATLQRIPEVSELEYLVLTGSKIDDQFVESLARLEKLTTLRLDQTPIRSASVSAISKLKNLEVLDIGGLQLTAENVSQLISSLSKLKHVTLVGAELTVDNMRQIAKLSSLQSLDLSNCELNDDLLNALAESPPAQLVELKLNSAKLGEAGFQNLVRKLRNTRFALKDTEVNPQTLDTLVMQGRATDIESIETPMRGGMNMNSIAMSENNFRIQRTTFGISVSRVLRSVEPLLERGELSVKEVEFLIKLAHGVSRPDLVEKLANYHVRHFSLSRFQQNDFARTLLGNARKEMRKK